MPMLSCFTVPRPLIGMLHAPPLPGSPGWDGDRASVLETVLQDAAALMDGGADGLLLENFGDAPFFPDRVPAETVAAMAWLATEIRDAYSAPLGINVLRNDGRSSLAIAAAIGADFIRVNVLCGARVADQGLLNGIAHDLLRDRTRLRVNVAILADVDVKHSAPLVRRPVEEEVAELLERGGADGLIVTGIATGAAADPQMLRLVKSASGAHPVFVGSGVTADNVRQFLPDADGFIVGTSLKRDGRVDADRVRILMESLGQSEDVQH